MAKNELPIISSPTALTVYALGYEIIIQNRLYTWTDDNGYRYTLVVVGILLPIECLPAQVYCTAPVSTGKDNGNGKRRQRQKDRVSP